VAVRVHGHRVVVVHSDVCAEASFGKQGDRSLDQRLFGSTTSPWRSGPSA